MKQDHYFYSQEFFLLILSILTCTNCFLLSDDGTVSKSQRQNPGPGAYAPTGSRYKASP